ncbi:antichymotrypsin-2-like [Zerene cesonia]|uniref:antichymotrypsin-2-like n=1 Tax=Zerene cesonia TaxID=33412 RepID=UPI0018E5905D|nr:antichymotrypsin-2-like [Zerene cesonia]
MRDSDDTAALDSYKNLDMSGTLRKSFFLANAIENIYNNTICSPISALLPLGKLVLRAEGATSDELLTAIGARNIDKVEAQTSNMIKNIISPNDISPDTSMILVNAVYFFGKWEEPFTKVQTGTFNTPNDVRRIHMMTKVAHFNYTDSESLDAKILKIPYNGGKASFLIVLPNTKNGLPMLLSQLKLAPEILDSALGTLTNRNVHVTIPKFKIEGDIDLRLMYEQIGVKRIFNEYESELNGIVKEKTLFVSKAKQKAMIDVNEYGTEAAAASAIVASKLSYEKTMQFRADHPFLYFVLSDKQQLFAGTLVYPPIV